MEFLGSITKYGAIRSRAGDKVRSLTLEVFGSFEGLDSLMERPLRITLVEEKSLTGSETDPTEHGFKKTPQGDPEK